MAVAVIMPRQGQSVESCIISEWHKKEGDQVQEGDILFSYETDKASFEEEAKTAGTLLKIIGQEGDDIPVLENVAIIGEPGEDISALLAETEQAAAHVEAAQPEAETPKQAAAAAPSASAAPDDGRLRISPRAAHLAQEQGIDAAGTPGSGPKGRIIERDVRALLAAGAGTGLSAGDATAADMPTVHSAIAGAGSPELAGAYTDVRPSNVRKAIAKTMQGSLSTMAQLTITSSFDATDILAYRQNLKKNAERMGLSNITLNDIVLFAVSRVLPGHPDLNAHYLDDAIRHFNHVNLGVAVDTTRGLLVPTIFGADMMSLNTLSETAKSLAAKAQEGSISPDYLSGGSFTVTNLGSLGVESFTPVINPPQTGILGVNTIETRVRESDGTLVPYKAMSLSLTFDHRAVDGAPAARFLHDLCLALESFSVLLAK